MKRDGEHRSTWWKRAGQAVASTLLVGATVGAAGCLSRPIDTLEPRTTTTEVEKLTESAVDKIDLLLMIDNSASMADKQSILGDAVSNLVNGLLNPNCVDANGNATMVPTPTEPCPAGTKRDFNAVFDVHIGMVTSSLGGHGSTACDPNNGGTPEDNDAGHLISRGGVATYMNQGYLQWDPEQKLSPPGIGDLNTMRTTLAQLVTGAGQTGCGYEASLEAWYRFLVNPQPYQSMAHSGNSYVQSGVDNTVLQQRADFMRPSSLLAIIMLSDENDCSVKEYSYYPAVNEGSQLPAPSSKCATDPADHCCASCGAYPSDCPTDSVCGTGQPPSLSATDDPANLRCFHNRQRFGIDFLYPIERYTIALTNAQIPDPHAGGGADGTNVNGALVKNPIFSDLNPNDSDRNIRDPSLVFIAGIVGVPYQDIARDPTNLTKGFKNAEEMSATNIKIGGQSFSTWDVIIGDPEKFVDPKDPHMIESEDPRSGTDPITGATLAPPTAAANTDPINGHEWIPSPSVGDLQYACTFVLPTPEANGADCQVPMEKNPLCDPNNYSSQVKAKGYPGIRELAVIKGAGSQGIVGSICPFTLAGTKTAPDYGYNPAVQGIIDRLKLALGGKCLARQLKPDAKGQVQCLIIEATVSDGACDCTSRKGHSNVPDANKAAIAGIKKDPSFASSMWNCFCEIDQLTGNDLQVCLNDPNDPTNPAVDGWCYVDTQVENANPDIVKNCPDDEKRLVRFVGEGNQAPGSTLFITCSGEQ